MVKEQKETRPEMDRRLTDHKLSWGLMSEEELSEYLETLPDVSENAEDVIFVMEAKK
jgi:hypothetical protein